MLAVIPRSESALQQGVPGQKKIGAKVYNIITIIHLIK